MCSTSCVLEVTEIPLNTCRGRREGDGGAPEGNGMPESGMAEKGAQGRGLAAGVGVGCVGVGSWQVSGVHTGGGTEKLKNWKSGKLET